MTMPEKSSFSRIIPHEMTILERDVCVLLEGMQFANLTPSLLKIPTKMKNKKDQMTEGWKSTGRISRTQRNKMR
jgi:hypothetical protein